MWEVYSIGDAELMYYALNGLAMIMNTGDWSTLTRIAIALGLLFAGFKAMTAFGDGRSVGPIFAAFLLGWAFFGPGSRTTVSLTDVYTGSVRQVANIPIGLAAPMSLVSKLGHRMAELMETAFSLPDTGKMTVAGYGDPLRVMLSLRDADPAVANSDGAASGEAREQSRRANGDSYSAWNSERSSVLSSLNQTNARDLPYTQRERLAEFLMTQRAGGELAHESVAALAPAIGARGLTSGGAMGNASLADRNTVDGLSPGVGVAGEARAAGAVGAAAGGAAESAVPSGIGRTSAEVAARRGAPAGTFAAGTRSADARHAGAAGALKASGTERGSNFGAREFAEVEKKRDTADQQRAVMRDKADKQGGDAIDNAISSPVKDALKAIGVGSEKNEAGWTDATDPANRPL